MVKLRKMLACAKRNSSFTVKLGYWEVWCIRVRPDDFNAGHVVRDGLVRI